VTAPRRARAPVEAPAEPLTASVEDYLKAIYEIERGTGAAGTNDIAQRLKCAPASVSGMIRRLSEAGLISHEPYRGARLTQGGRRAALKTLRRHRVIEAYLTDALDYPWDRVHAEAERLEHAASDDLIDRMAAAIGEPRTDPHGAPIPTREGAMDDPVYRSVADVPAGGRARVVRVSDDDPSLLRYLGELGIVPGADVRVVSRAPFEGPITLRIGREDRPIGVALASQILVDESATARGPGRKR
jgi:DtxR family transcriptional regulator, Mn-dependent transcriptional regulator